MYQQLTVNVLIVTMIIAGLAITGNPLFIFGLMFLAQMPVIIPKTHIDAEDLQSRTNARGEEDDDGYPAQPVGFTANVDDNKRR